MSFLNYSTFVDEHTLGRVYFHEVGFHEVFKGDEKNQIEYTRAALKNNRDLLKGDYFISEVWGDFHKGDKVMNIFTYSGINNWPGNPEAHSWVFKDGLYVPDERNIACSTTIRLLGREEEYRQATSSLHEYLWNPAN